MLLRVIGFLVISILVHVLFFSQSFTRIAIPDDYFHWNKLASVGLVEGVQPQDKVVPVLSNAVQGTEKPADSEDGMSFKTEGIVSKGYMDLLKTRIFKTWQYPEDAVNNGRQGRVTISFVLNEKGDVVEVGVLKPSGTPSLDSAAVAAVKQSAPFGPFGGDAGQKTLKITGNFCYVLD